MTEQSVDLRPDYLSFDYQLGHIIILSADMVPIQQNGSVCEIQALCKIGASHPPPHV